MACSITSAVTHPAGEAAGAARADHLRPNHPHIRQETRITPRMFRGDGTGSRSLGGVYAVLYRVADQLGPVVELELPQRVLYVVLHRAVRKNQACGDLASCETSGYQAEDFGLALGQLGNLR